MKTMTGRVRMAVALFLTFLIIWSVVVSLRPSDASSSSWPKGRSSLAIEQRWARERYWGMRRGLQFGVPQNAYENAVRQLELMDAASIPSPAVKSATASALTWNFIGPQPMCGEPTDFGALPTATGRISALAVDRQGNIFAGAASGGVWLSEDKGKSFKPITDNLPTQAIGSIAIDYFNVTSSNQPYVYVGTGEGNGSCDSLYGMGLFRSRDFGHTWEQVGQAEFAEVAQSPRCRAPIA